MKKGLVFAVILLVMSVSVIAQNESDKLVPRMTNFMGDNVHIIRVQELSEKLDTQIAVLDEKLIELESKLYELEKIKSNLNTPVKVSTTGLAAQYGQINSEMRDIKRSVDELKDLKQEIEQEKQAEPRAEKDSMALFIVALLAVNSVLLIALVGIYYVKRPKPHAVRTMHEYIAQCLDEGVEEHEIKHELLKKGWATKEIDHAFKEVKE